MSPATSESQRKMFCIAYAIKLGRTPKSYSPEAAKMAKEMSLEQLSDFCRSPIKKE